MMPDSPTPKNSHRPPGWRGAIIILLLGILIAGGVWWRGQAATALADDPAMQGFDRTSHRQMGLFFGKSGYLMEDFFDAVKQPHIQAALVLATAVLLAGGWWWLARWPAVPADPDFFKPTAPADKPGQPPAPRN